ncbi:hypothetical protein SSX86_032625 [Deinandra increscens subsp. villosa]|uniref:Uncharacterized protein n=1 Tax=Deinandra increscens subsp. villosa TaxID=3103831 RepID=A0AAP0C7I2_9ASTR
MLALSPPLFSTTYGWPMEDPIPSNHLAHDCNEANSYSSLLDFHIYDQINHKSLPQYSNSSDEARNGGGSGDSMKVERKLNHNASERDRQTNDEDSKIEPKSLVISSVNMLGDKEVVVQLISSTDQARKNQEIIAFSKVLEYLEQEEDELVLINAIAIQCLGEGMFLNTLHLQVQRDQKIEVEKLKEKLNLNVFNQ